MLEIIIPSTSYFDESTNLFIDTEEVTLQLEHSLVSLSKWESKWEKPFLDDIKKTTEETIGYVEAMCLTPNIPSKVFDRLTEHNLKQISDYIDSKMTATWFIDNPMQSQTNKKEIITAEIIYYWMVALTIPFEFESWHLNRLFTLIRVTNEKNAPPKANQKVGRATMASNRRALAEQRRQQYKTNG